MLQREELSTPCRWERHSTGKGDGPNGFACGFCWGVKNICVGQDELTLTNYPAR